MNFKSFSWSLEQFFLTVGQNNFGNKIPFILVFNLYFFLDHFHPSEEILAEGLPVDEDLAEDQDLDDKYTLEELFKELESGDPAKANRVILQKKKLFVPMRKHFQVCILILFLFIGFWTQNTDLPFDVKFVYNTWALGR